jgi:predicted hydrocarbon binding protein
MMSSLSATPSRSVSVPSEFFAALRAAATRTPESVTASRDAGYAAGVALYDSFGAWLHDRGDMAPEMLPLEDFGDRLAAFLSAAGWGRLRVQRISNAVMALDTEDWAEAGSTANAAGPSCHVGTGLLAGFFGRVAEAPLAVLEVECRSAGASHCRFLVGSVDVLQYVYEAMDRGVSYEHAASSASTG